MPRGRSTGPSPSSNRTDLLSPSQPASVAPGQPYGKAQDQLEAERIAPMAGGATAPAPSGGPAGSPSAQGSPEDLMAALQSHNGPGNSLNLMRPTERPNEPVTHGLPVGPGGGPEALTGVGAAAREGAVDQATLSQFLSTLSSQPNATSAVKALASLSAAGQQ